MIQRIWVEENPVAGFQYFRAWVTKSVSEAKLIVEALRILGVANEEIKGDEHKDVTRFYRVRSDDDGNIAVDDAKTEQEIRKHCESIGLDNDDMEALTKWFEGDQKEPFETSPIDYLTVERIDI